MASASSVFYCLTVLVGQKTFSLFFQFMPVVSPLTTIHHPEELDCIILITPLQVLTGCCFILSEACPSLFWPRPNVLACPHQATVPAPRHRGGLSLYVHYVINVFLALRGLKWDTIFRYSLRSDEQREDQSSEYTSLLDMLLFIQPRMFGGKKKRKIFINLKERENQSMLNHHSIIMFQINHMV